MTTEYDWLSATRLRILVSSGVIIPVLALIGVFGIPTTSQGNPEATVLEQQILNNRQRQDLIRDQRGYQERLDNTAPADQSQLKQRLQQQRFHQKQLQHREIQRQKNLQLKNRAQTGIKRSNRNATELQRSRRAQESQRLQHKLERRTWRYR